MELTLKTQRLYVVFIGLVLMLSIRVFANAPSDRYVTGVDTVFDAETQLTWQRGVADGGKTLTSGAMYCSSLILGGFDGGWRLPDYYELNSLVDVRNYGPAIDTVAFPGTPSDYFWSSSLFAGDPSLGWVVHFAPGVSNFTNTTSAHRVRCVH